MNPDEIRDLFVEGLKKARADSLKELSYLYTNFRDVCAISDCLGNIEHLDRQLKEEEHSSYSPALKWAVDARDELDRRKKEEMLRKKAQDVAKELADIRKPK